MSTRTRQDWILWAQLGCALVVTFHAEYTLALAAGVHPWVALAVPGALDLYVIRALQKHRDVFLAVLVMVVANVASHLVAAGIVPVGWAVYSAVGGTVPLLLWRGHSLRSAGAAAEVPAGAVSAPEDDDPVEYLPVPEDVPSSHPCDLVMPHGARFTDRCEECGYAYGVHPLPMPTDVPPVPEYDPDPDLYVPEDWREVHLKAVPDLPPDVPAVYSSHLLGSDLPYLERASEYVHQVRDEKRTPTVRGLKAAISVGQERAKRLLQHLEGETK